MEKSQRKCLFKDHKDIDATSYCQECKIYMCNKCSNYHQGLLSKHHQYNLDKDLKDIFIDICKEENHPLKLEYYCKNHNQLCCVACIAKIEGKGYGKHNNCEICFIENIKDEKKNKLKENIKYLEDLSKNFEDSIKELKEIFENIDKNKEELKLKIQKIFTQLRNALNEREDELLSDADKEFNTNFCDENIIKDCQNLPNKIKISLEKGKLINNEWDDNNKLSSLIYDCINIEDNINNINIVNDNIKKCKLNYEVKIDLMEGKKSVDNLIKKIKNFGKVMISKFFDDSVILKDKSDIEKFYKLISNNIMLNNMKLIFRLNKDGRDFQTFINKVNNKSNLIFLYLTGNKRIFGVFIKTKLENIKSDKYYNDENAFVFSLDNNKIYKILQPKNAIRTYDGFLVKVGNTGNSNGFYLSCGSIYDKGLLNTPKIYDFQKNDELTEGLNKLTEIEIFEINI